MERQCSCHLLLKKSSFTREAINTQAIPSREPTTAPRQTRGKRPFNQNPRAKFYKRVRAAARHRVRAPRSLPPASSTPSSPSSSRRRRQRLGFGTQASCQWLQTNGPRDPQCSTRRDERTLRRGLWRRPGCGRGPPPSAGTTRPEPEPGLPDAEEVRGSSQARAAGVRRVEARGEEAPLAR